MHAKYRAKVLQFNENTITTKKHYELSILKPTTIMSETFTKMMKYAKFQIILKCQTVYL